MLSHYDADLTVIVVTNDTYSGLRWRSCEQQWQDLLLT